MCFSIFFPILIIHFQSLTQMKRGLLTWLGIIVLWPGLLWSQAVPELMYFKFDGGGTTVPNQASTPVGTNPATLNGGMTQGPGGQFGGALIGTGGLSTLDNMNTGWATSLTGSWTIAFWTSNIQPSATLWYIFGDANAGGFRCFTNGVAGANNWILRGTGITDVLVNGAATAAPNMIHFVYDAPANQIRAYVNGVLNNTVTQAAGLSVNGTGPFQVGSYATNNGLPGLGLMDEFRIYNRALSLTEIQTTWNQTLPIATGPKDLALSGLTSPVATPGSCFGPNQTVTVLLYNFGTDTLNLAQNNAQVTLNVTGPNPQSFSTTLTSGILPPGANQPVTLATTYNMGAGGTYVFNGYVAFVTGGPDANLSNDTMATVSVFNSSVAVTPGVAFQENFETFIPGAPSAPGTFQNGWTGGGSGFWYCAQTTGTQISSLSTGPFVDNTFYPNPGGKVIYLETSSGGVGAESFLNSPCIDLSAVTAPTLRYAYHMFGATMGSLVSQIQPGGSGTWITLDSLAGQQQASGTDPWGIKTISLAAYAGQVVRIRFKGIRGTSFTSDMAVDDISIFEPAPNDLVITEMLTPTVPNCSFTGAETVSIKYTNAGNNVISLSNVQATFQVTGPNNTGPVTEVLPAGTINPGDTLTYVFTGTANMAVNGAYTVTVGVNFTPASGITDGAPSNNSTTIAVSPGITGTYTINSALPTGGTNYASFTALANDFAAFGICGPVVVNVVSGSGPYTEQVSFGQITGMNATNTVIINGNGETLQFLSTNTNERATLKLNGSDFFTFNNLKVEALGSVTGEFGWAVWLTNNADNNTFNGCEFRATENSTLTNFAGFVTSSSATSPVTAGNAASRLTVTNCLAEGGYYGMVINGPTTGTFPDSCVINNNQVRDYYLFGLYLRSLNNSLVSGNESYRQDRATISTTYGIYLNGNFTGTVIDGNEIRNLAGVATTTATAFAFYGTGVTANTGSELLVSNNLISGFDNMDGADYGIYMLTTNGAKFYHNTVSVDNVNHPGAGIVRAFYHTGANSVIDLRNNIFSITTNSTGAKHLIYLGTNTAVVTSNYNVLHMGATAGSNSIGFLTSNQPTLADWQLLGFDADGVTADPIFSGNTLFPSNSAVDNIATPLAQVTTDFFGVTRSVTPDPGAIEFAPSPFDVGVSAIKGVISGCALGGSAPITVTLTNYGTDTTTSIPVTYTVNGTPVTETAVLTLLPGTSADYTFTATANLGTPGTTYTFNAWTSFVGDNNAFNDSTLGVTGTHYPSITGYPYFQSFDGPAWTPSVTPFGTPVINLPDGWINLQGDGSQDWAVRSGTTPSAGTGPASDHTTGSGKYLYVEDTSPFNNDSVILLSPCFNLAGLLSPKVSFWYHSNNPNTPNDENELHLDLLVNGSLVLDVIPSIAHKDNNWNLIELDLFAYAGGTVGFRFRVNNSNNFGNHDIAIDDFNLVDVLPQDAGVTAVAEPLSGCGLPAVDTLVLALANLGTDTIFGGLNVSYTINGGAVNTVAITSTIFPGFLVPVSFPGVSFAVPGDYTVKAWSSGLTGDTNFFNDTVTTVIKSIPLISTFPYVQDFESGDGGWVKETAAGSTSSWGFGTPAKPVIQGAASGVNAWATALNLSFLNSAGIAGVYNPDENGWVISPCFDFTNLGQPKIELSVWWSSEFSWDGAVLQSTIDNGLSWQNVGALGDPDNWYNDGTVTGAPGGSQQAWTGTGANSSGGWVTAKNTLTGLGGQPAVRLRVAFGSDGSVQNDGFAFDDIFIYDTPSDDVGVVAITDPNLFGCSDDSTLVQVQLVNFGSDTASNVPVLVNVSGAGTTQLTATFPGPLAPGDTSSFIVGYLNTNAGGIFNLAAFTAYVGDTLVFNDTTFSSTDVTVSPAAPVAVSDSVILCVPDSAMLMVLNDTNFSYIWYDAAVGGNVLANDTNVFQTGFLTSDTSYWVEAVPGGGGPAIKVTEAELLGPDYVEIQNTGNTPVNVNGWTIIIGEDGAAGINTVATTSKTLTGVMNPGDILWYDDATASGANYWGANILWNGGQEGWVVILDAQKNVVDAMFFNYTDAQIQTFAPTFGGSTIQLNGQWTGDGVVSTGFQNLRRVGNTDSNTNVDWLGNATANTGIKGQLNPGMSLPVTGGGSGGGCPSERTEIKVLVAPDVPVDLGPDGLECAGFVINAFDPSFATYTWSTGATTPSITADTTGLYFVDVTNAFGCTGSDSIFLAVNPSPTVDLGPADTTVCGTITLDAGNPGSTFVWSEPGQFGQTLDVTQSGQYFVTVNLLGCENSDTINITVSPAPAVNLGADLTSCDDVVLNAGNPGSSYLWSTGATSQSITVTPPATGSITVSVVVTNSALCDASDEIVISAGVAPVVNLGPDQTACNSITLDAGIANASYLWSNGATTKTITVTTSGTYSVTVTDGAGCEGTDEVVLTVEQKPVADFTFVNAQFGFTYDFTSTSQGATSYFWDFGDGAGTSTAANPSYTYFFPGDYEVTLIVENACGKDTLKVRVNGVNIEDELFGGMIRLYPNPTKGEFFLVADEFQSEELSIEVTDVRGRQVYSESQRNVFGGFEIRVDLSGEAEGVYQVKISDGTRTAYKRVIRE